MISHDLPAAIEAGGSLRRLFDAVPELVTVSSLDGPALYVNPSARRELGIGSEEPVDSLLDYRPPGFARYLREVIVPMASDGAWQGETDFVRRTGDLLRVFQTTILHPAADGVNYLVCLAHQVDSAGAPAGSAGHVEARTRFALEVARAGVWEADLRTGQVCWSESMRAVQGFSEEEFAGTLESFLSLVHPEDQHAVHRVMHPGADHPRDFTVEFRALWPDGAIHWVEVHGRVISDATGEPARVLAMAQDVTERKLLEAQLRQAQKMEAVGQLAGGLAHDFNNLLTAIAGYAALVAADLGDGDPRRPDVEEITKAADRAAQLTRQLLAFGRRQVLQPVTIDLNALVLDISRMIGRLIGEHIELALRLHAHVDPIRADRGQIEQVIVNLAVNARDAMESGGTLTVSSAMTHLDERAGRDLGVAPGPYVVLSLSDTGAGMTEETKARIFEPFFTTKDRGRGTGLGLSTVFGIIRQSGAAIDVTSEPGRGTRFDLYFPVTTERTRPTAKGTETTPIGGSEVVLLVEDETAVRNLARQILVRNGYEVLAAADAQEALDLADDGRSIDLVLTDVVMPGISGPDLCARLRVRRPDVPVLFMSGFARQAVAGDGLVSAGSQFLQKPFTGPDLLRRVRTVLDQRVSAPPESRSQPSESRGGAGTERR